MEQLTNTHGGKREGAGRKNTNRNQVLYIRITPEAMERLDQLTNNRSEFINQLILNHKD